MANVEPLRKHFDFYFLTDGHGGSVPDTRARFYARLNTAQKIAGFSKEDELDVIERCRFLRNIPRAQALSILRAMASVLAEELDAYAPHVVLSHMVDDYITHLLAELARRRGVTFTGFAYSYFPGKVQVTQYSNGSPLDLRTPTDEETAQVLQQISKHTFRQNYLQNDTYTRARHLKAMLRYRLKQLVFAWRSWWQKDPLNMHYACLPFVVERRRWSDFPSSADFHADWKDRISSANDVSKKPIIYFPLSYFPEATIDYWIANRNILNYQESVLEICRVLGRDFHVVVKEHLHMIGARSTEFYRQLRAIAGVTSVPPLEFSNNVIELADAVLLGGGSIGVESFIRGKPIVSFCTTSYWFPHVGAVEINLDAPSDWPQCVHKAISSYKSPTEQVRIEFIRQCLRSTMRQERPGAVWPICQAQDMFDLLHVAAMQSKAYVQ